MSDFDAYQDFTDTTSLYEQQIETHVDCPSCGHRFSDPRQRHLAFVLYCFLGFVGEVGEFAEKLKKKLRGGGDLRDLVGDEGVLKELGDSPWYHARLTKLFGFRLSQVFDKNKEKILSRKQRGVLHGEGDDR